MGNITINPHGWAICLHTEDNVETILSDEIQKEPWLARLLTPSDGDPQQFQQFHHEGRQEVSEKRFPEFHTKYLCLEGEQQAMDVAERLSKILCEAGARHVGWVFPAKTLFTIELARKKEHWYLTDKEIKHLNEDDKLLRLKIEELPSVWWTSEGKATGQVSIRAEISGIVIETAANPPVSWEANTIPVPEIQEELRAAPHLELKGVYVNSQVFFGSDESLGQEFSYEQTLENLLNEKVNQDTTRRPMRKT